MKMQRLLVALATAGLAALAGLAGILAPVDGAYAGKARGQLYSTAAVNRFCKGAQGIIANTILQPDNILFDDLGMAGIPFPPPGTPATGFIGSDAAPWDGNEGAPLSTTQYVGFGFYPNGSDYPQTIMCKMKSWDAIEFYYGPGAAADGASCSDINADTYARVLNSLTNPNQEPEVITEVAFDEWVSFTGQQWTSEAPATTAYTSTVDGKVHIVGKPLYVARTNPSPFVGPEKKGVHYCQIIAPEYLREIIIGNIVAPTCDAPPAYAPPAGPPAPPPLWDCENP